MEPLRYQYDELGSAAVNILNDIARKAREGVREQATAPVDLYAILQEHHSNDEVLAEFWEKTHAVPEWVDWEQLRRGQDFFYRYALPNLMGFALQGFMGENSAAGGVVEVLVRTGGFSTRKLLHRLLETFQFVLQVTESLDAIQPGGVGHTAAVRVRLLHSSVRERILKLTKTRPEYFDVRRFGQPVNTLDSIHSVAVFSCNHTWLQLPFMGVYPREQEASDYIALFRYVGYVLGVPDGYFTTTAMAKATMEGMLLRELRVTATSHTVAHNFIQCLTDLPAFNVSTQFIEAGSRVLNGDTFCDSLGLGRPGLYHYACFRGFCWLVKTLAVIQHVSPAVDKALLNRFRHFLHHFVIKSKSGLAGGSKFDFKHVPQIGKQVGKEDHDRTSSSSAFFARPVEIFHFGIFVIGCLFMVGALCVFCTMLWLMYRNLKCAESMLGALQLPLLSL